MRDDKHGPALILTSDDLVRDNLARALHGLGHEALVASSVSDAAEILERTPVRFSVLQANPEGDDLPALLARLRGSGGDPGPVVLVSDEASVDQRLPAEAGAVTVIRSSTDWAEVESAVRAVTGLPTSGARHREDVAAAAGPWPEVGLWTSPRMQDVWEMIQQAARVDVPVLIGGETGTGKDLAARAIHYLSSRRNGPFVKINCAAVPRELLETELFGDEREPFTLAHRVRMGKLETANHGTIFLDEIGDLHPALQAKLLHVLQDGMSSRVGGRSTVEVDVRALAATKRDLERTVAEQGFREDLYYRLNVIQIVMPPLRERLDEVPNLARYFAQRYSRAFNREGFTLGSSAIERLTRYRYPGNVRELENVVKRMIALDDPDLSRTPFGSSGAEPGGGDAAPAGPAPGATVSLKDVARSAARAAEREAIAHVLAQTGWNRVRSAKLLKISYRALLYKIKETGVDRASQSPDGSAAPR